MRCLTSKLVLDHLNLGLSQKCCSKITNSYRHVIRRAIVYGSNTPEEKQMIGEEDLGWIIKRLSRNTMPLDLSLRGVRHMIKRNLRELEYERQRFSVEQRNLLTPELTALSFIVMIGGQAKCEGQSFWIHSMSDHEALLPLDDRFQTKIEAVNLSGTDIMYHGIENLEGTDLKWLSIRECPNINDFCLNRIANEFKDTLEYLDVSGCPNITHRGLGTLHKTRKLKTLVMQNLPRLEHPELATVMVSEVIPDCEISGYISTIPPEEESMLRERDEALLEGENTLPEQIETRDN